MLGLHLNKQIFIFGMDLSFLKQKFRKKIPGIIVTTLGNTFTMKKALVQIIFGHLILICEPISIIFAALFKTFGMLKDDKVRFLSGCLCTW